MAAKTITDQEIKTLMNPLIFLPNDRDQIWSPAEIRKMWDNETRWR